MEFFEAFIVLFATAIVGSLFGSFINVVAIRAHENSSIMGRSHCMHCKAKLHPRHLVPIFSWLVQRGKCAMCGKPISAQYPLVELAAALLAVISVARFMPEMAWGWVGFEFFFMLSLLIFVVMDMRWMELPLELMVGVGIVFSVWHMTLQSLAGASTISILWSHASGFAIVALFFMFQYVVSGKRWIGAGDIWLGGVLGAVLGWPLVGIAIYFSYIFGGGIALLLLLSKKIKPGMRIPFAPALISGTLAALWWGPGVLAWISHAIS
ncbi:MAG: prepilin peptidase [Patescibacteria group bacterium]|nr:prepilin peptidase [Patescibacteria group bacterium]